MTIELSTPIKILTLALLALVVGAAGLFILESNRSTSPQSVPASHAKTTHAPTHTASHHSVVPRHVAPAVHFAPFLPQPLQHALLYSRLVVAVVYAPGNPIDAQVLAQARQGARSVHAKVIALNIHNEQIAASTAAWMKSPVEPAVLVVGRTGRIAVELDGYADSMTVAQAVVDARR